MALLPSTWFLMLPLVTKFRALLQILQSFFSPFNAKWMDYNHCYMVLWRYVTSKCTVHLDDYYHTRWLYKKWSNKNTIQYMILCLAEWMGMLLYKRSLKQEESILYRIDSMLVQIGKLSMHEVPYCCNLCNCTLWEGFLIIV